MMPLTRTLPVVPGLARLLADLPRERLTAVAADWGVDRPEQAGVVAAVYRRMTDAAVVGPRLAELTESERLIFDRLRRSARPTGQSELLRALPFSEEFLVEKLRGLEERGLVWKLAPAGRDRESEGTRWLVARDLNTSTESMRVRPGDTRAPTSPPVKAVAAPNVGPMPMAHPPSQPRPSGEVLRLVDTLGEVALGRLPAVGPQDKDRREYATHCAESLGIVTVSGKRLKDGARLAEWLKLGFGEKVRVLARFWRVDDTASHLVPESVRYCLFESLARLPPDSWFEVDDVARAAALIWGEVRSGSAPNSAQLRGTPFALARRDLERGLDTLSWLGVVELAFDTRERPVAVRVNETGHGALV